MSRRKAAAADSLELLLDTICNTFGGILFIAILVIILLQTTGTTGMTGDREQSAPELSVNPERFEELANRLEAIVAERAALEKFQVGRTEMVEKFASDENRELLRTKQALSDELNRARTARDQQLASNAREQAALDETQLKLDDVRRSFEETQAETERLQLKLEQDRKSRQKEVQLPVVHAAHGKSEVGFILRYGRAYLWHAYDGFGNRSGLNLDEFVVIETNSSGLVTRPKPTAGIVLNDAPATREKIGEKLQQFSPLRHVITIVVRPDSYDAFRHFKGVVVEKGFEYRLMPMNETGAVQDRGGSDGRVQ